METKDAKEKKKKLTKPTKGSERGTPYQFDILAIIEARNEQRAKMATLIQKFESKIKEFFAYVGKTDEGQRLIVKTHSHVTETEIYNDFAKIYVGIER